MPLVAIEDPALDRLEAGFMTMDRPPLAPHSIPPPSRPRRRWLLVVVAVLWVGSLALVWWCSVRWGSPHLAAMKAENARLREQSRQFDDLNQRVATLKRSDDISRAANQELQTSLSERDEEVSALRADVAFYERLVGTSGQRRGLSVHSVKMEKDANGSWHYAATLTQNLNRGKISQGEMTLQIEGAKAGKLQTLQWDDLLQKPSAPPQPFDFRYFEKVEGNVMLPPGFTPNRVRVYLRAEGTTIQQVFPWSDALRGEAAAPGGGKTQ
ncbi:MAG TPA: DUF6776 family protein [Xanthomonadaceae bacterium]|jgi:hypothetical protein|nr:DUF6776 family protein [Xanthomonadaceae bacterium]